MSFLTSMIQYRTLIKSLFGIPISVKDFGAVGNGTADDTTAIQAALTYAVANAKTLFFPTGIYLISSTLNVTGKWSIAGEGSLSRIKTTDTTIPLFTFNINTTTVLHGYIGNVHFLGPQSTNAASCALRFVGDDTAYIQFCTFENIWCTDFNAFIKDEKLPRTTANGLEAMLNWNIWTNIHLYNVSNWGFWCTQGSGTGNTWTDIKSMLREAGAATWFFEGTGCVVGDVIIEGAHLGGRDLVTGCIGVKVGADIEYKSRCSITGSQFDAHCDTPLDISSTGGDEGNNWKFSNNNLGGNAVLNMPYMSQSVIEDKDVDLRQTGRRITTSSTGALTTDCFNVGVNTYGSSFVTVIANGLVGGVAAAFSEYTFHVMTTGAAMTITEIEGLVSNSGQLTWTCTSTDVNTAKLTLSYTPSGTGTDLSVVAFSRGHKHKLTRV